MTTEGYMEPVMEAAAVSVTAETATETPSKRPPGSLAPLRRRNFLLLFLGQLVSVFGDQAYMLALPWTVLAVTGDARQMAAVLAAGTVARVAMLLIGGALADRLAPRLIMLLADVGRAGVVGALGVTLFVALPSLWIVAALAALEGVGSGLFLPGSQALIPATVPEEELPAANGLMMVVQFLSMAVGPLLGGIATAAQASIAFIMDGGSFLVSALTLFGIRLPVREAAVTTEGRAAQAEARRGMGSDIAAGFRYALAHPLIRIAMVVTVFGNFAFSGVLGVSLIVLIHDVEPSALTLGIVLASAGAGGIIGGLGSALLGRLRHRGRIALILWIINGGIMAAMPVFAGKASALPFALQLDATATIIAESVLIGFIGLILAMADTMFITILQQRIAPDYMARVFSIQFLAGGITQPLSLVTAGFVAATFGPGISFIAGGAILITGVLIGCTSRELRNI